MPSTTPQVELKISKLDAAKRQLETAIRLYFHDGDPVSIHTLVQAGYNVIRDYNKKIGGEPMLMKEKMLEFVKAEMRDEFRKAMQEAENFFKHAERDHDAVLNFRPRQSEIFLWEACTKYWELAGEQPPLLALYRGWFMATRPEVFDVPEKERQLQHTAAGVTKNGRGAFFKEMLPLYMEQGSSR